MVPSDLVPAPEPFSERVALLSWNVRMPERVVSGRIWIAAVLKVITTGFEAMSETIGSDFIKFSRNDIPATLTYHRAWPHGAAHVRHGYVISAHEALTIGLPQVARYRRSPEFRSIIGVGSAIVPVVVASGSNAFVEAAALYVVPGIGWPVPVVTVLREAGRLGQWSCSLNAWRREQQERRASEQSC